MPQLKPALILPLAAVLVLSACTGTGPRQNTGAATGAVAGGLLGGLISGKPAGAAVGAVGGAIVGGAIGSELDKQAGELRAGFGDNRIGVTNTGSSLVVTMPQDILFDTDSAKISRAIRADLRVLAAHLNKYADSNVQVVGHTDNQGAASYNLNLSRQRAASVSQVLLNQGVAPFRVTSIGRGEDQPVASNLTPEGRAQNRRVEIIIIPTG
mgnify:CR=1 FL=1